MSATDAYKRSRRQLDTIKESWNEDHESALECLDFEEFLRLMSGLFQAFDAMIQQRHEAVYRGELESNSEFDRTERDLYTRWVELANEMAQALQRFEKIYKVHGAEQFREDRELAQRRLGDWTPVKASTATGLLTHNLDDDEAAEFRAFLANPEIGKPKATPKAIPEAGAEILDRFRKRNSQ